MRGYLIVAAALAAAAPASAQDASEANEENEPKRTVALFMDAFSAQDAEAMRAHVVEGASVTVIEERAGADRSRTVSLDGLISTIAASPADLDEPVWGMATLRSGPVASVMTSYQFLIDGELSHCGKNIFGLSRVDGEWKIASIVYSHIEEDCEEADEQ